MPEINAHTPGPWEFGGIHNSVIAQSETGWDDDKSTQAYNGHLVCESIKWEANARLIAAAPDLLEALKDIMDKIERSGVSHKIGSTKGYAAIAKATGETA